MCADRSNERSELGQRTGVSVHNDGRSCITTWRELHNEWNECWCLDPSSYVWLRVPAPRAPAQSGGQEECNADWTSPRHRPRATREGCSGRANEDRGRWLVVAPMGTERTMVGCMHMHMQVEHVEVAPQLAGRQQRSIKGRECPL